MLDVPVGNLSEICNMSYRGSRGFKSDGYWQGLEYTDCIPHREIDSPFQKRGVLWITILEP